jgi:gamma-aminobutyric acid type B receptor
VSPPQWTTTDGKKPLDSPRNETTYEEQGSFIVASIFAGFGVVFAIIMLTFNEYHRDKRVIKLSSPRLNNLIAIGAIAIYLSVIMSGLDGDFFPINSQSLAFCYVRQCCIVIKMSYDIVFG